jgi:cell division protein FtsN
MRRQARKSGGAAGLFVLLGILTILAVTFAAGTYAGRIWATKPHVATAAVPAERESGRRGAEARSARIAEPAPRLTFYHELTAPLTAPPPPPKPAKPSPPLIAAKASTAEKASAETAAVTLNSSATGEPATTLPVRSTQAGLGGAATPGRFTIQVGAYRLRPPADALRSALTAAGHDARVVETDAPNGVRFRVQIGDFSSRDAARDAAARLSGPTFVTTR